MWIDVLTLTGTPDSVRFYRDVEQWFFGNYDAYAAVHPEWSKGWAYGTQSGWSDPTVLNKWIPAAYRAGRKVDDNWDWELRSLNRFDPHRDLLQPVPRHAHALTCDAQLAACESDSRQ